MTTRLLHLMDEHRHILDSPVHLVDVGESVKIQSRQDPQLLRAADDGDEGEHRTLIEQCYRRPVGSLSTRPCHTRRDRREQEASLSVWSVLTRCWLCATHTAI